MIVDGAYFEYLTNQKYYFDHNWPLVIIILIDVVLFIALEVKIERDNSSILRTGNVPYTVLTIKFLAFLVSGIQENV